MELKTTLDVDLVAVETADEVAVLLDLAADPDAGGASRPRTTTRSATDRVGRSRRPPLTWRWEAGTFVGAATK
jgi:hypothetical protein